MTVQEYSDFMLKHSLIYLIVCIGIGALIFFGDMLFNQHIESAILAMIFSAVEVILILVYVISFCREFFDKELKNKLNYSKRLLDNRMIRYENVVIAHQEFQFKLTSDLDKLLLKELIYISQTHMEIKKTDNGTWLIICWERS